MKLEIHVVLVEISMVLVAYVDVILVQNVGQWNHNSAKQGEVLDLNLEI